MDDKERNDVDESLKDEGGQEVEEDSEEIMEISIHVLVDSNRTRTIKPPGRIKGRRISILINGWSTHSFIDELLASNINCRIQQVKPVFVTVAGGEKLISGAVYKLLV